MTWPVRSRLLHQDIKATPGANTVYYSAFVPTGKTWLVKDFVFWNGGAGGQNAYLYSVTGAALTVVANFLGIGNGGNGTGTQRSIVVPAGSRLAWSVSLNQLTHVTISGAQLG